MSTYSYHFDERHDLFRSSLRDLIKKEIEPHMDEWEQKREMPRSIWKKFGDMGFLGLIYPEAYGGSDMDFFYTVIFAEELSKIWGGGVSTNFLVSQYMSSPYILHHGSEELKQKYLPKTAAGEYIAAVGITEPDVGSDVANIKTKAERQGDYFIVNGAKTFITNGYYADYIIATVRTTEEQGYAGISLLVIDFNSEGITRTKLNKLGLHSSDTSEIGFNNVKVPVSNLIGEEGHGFYYLMEGLQLERLVGAIGPVASCEKMLEYALDYMKERHAFGKSISKFQVLRHRVAQLHSEIEVTKAFIYHCCKLQNDKQYAVKETSIAKLMATELAKKVADECLQFLGGYGYMEDYKLARAFRDSRVGTIVAGTSDIMREIISKMYIDEVNYKK